MIYAQRPDATACAPIELWNSTFKRWVNKGAKGIAIIDDSGQKPMLRYVFDVSDTNTRYNIPFKLWEAKPEQYSQIVEELQNHFGDTGVESDTMPEHIMGVVVNAVSDNYEDYAEQLLNVCNGSALADKEDAEIGETLLMQLMTSVSHTIMVRMGILHIYIRDLLVCGCLYDDIIENEPRYYWEKYHDETLFQLFHHSISEAGTIPTDDCSDEIAFAESVNTFYCDYINDEWANHVFVVLYSNKDFLFRFSSEIARVVQTLKKDDYPQYLKSDGVVKRKTFPKWLIKGVNARDRYHCQLCGKELSGGLYPTRENYDHIIPLELSGTNDATNIQLTCESCNKKKGARNMDYKNIIIPFW